MNNATFYDALKYDAWFVREIDGYHLKARAYSQFIEAEGEDANLEKPDEEA